MKKYTDAELENMDVVELTKLAEAYGATPLMIRNFTWKEIVQFIHVEQILA